MKLITILKLCILGGFIGTIFTGFLFVMRSDEQQIKSHVKDINNNLEGNVYGKHEESIAHNKNDKNLEFPQINIDKPKIEETIIEEKEKDLSEKNSEVVKPPPLKEQVEDDPTLKEKIINITTTQKVLRLKESSRSPSVHIFYYPWYGAPEFDGGNYYHWNHRYLNEKNEPMREPNERHNPPDDIASVNYPSLGAYSSSNLSVIEQHMKWLSSAGVDVVVASWYPNDKHDNEGKPLDPIFPSLLNLTQKFKMKLAFHLEPYAERSASSVRDDIEYIITNYGDHPAFYRTYSKTNRLDQNFPLFYIYDSYLIGIDDWASIASINGKLTIRNTKYDSLLIGLFVNKNDEIRIKDGGFDGIYTYFASENFSYGSTMGNWPNISSLCDKSELLFIPSVGPGYNDTRVRPWNTKSSQSRNKGEYYREHFKMAHVSKADIVSITSFNEWHEGTQIEPAIKWIDTNGTGYYYNEYDKGPNQYLEITLEMVNTYFSPHHKKIPMQISKIV